MKRYVKFTNHKGFTLVEVLLSMFVLSIALLMLVPCVRVMRELARSTYANEDAIAIQQLRLVLAQSEQLQSDHQVLTFTLYNQKQTLSLHHHRLVKQEGYIIYLKDITSASFYQEGGCTHVLWTREKKEKDALLVCE